MIWAWRVLSCFVEEHLQGRCLKNVIIGSSIKILTSLCYVLHILLKVFILMFAIYNEKYLFKEINN